MTSRQSCDFFVSFPQTQIQNGQLLYSILKICCVFSVKTPFSNLPGRLGTRPKSEIKMFAKHALETYTICVLDHFSIRTRKHFSVGGCYYFTNLHCDLKSNNVPVTDKHGQIIDFGKACDISFPPAKKYTFHYAHIAPEVLNGTHCSKASDVYSFGRILHEIATKQKIPMLLDNAQKCLDINTRRPTTTGLMASLASLICSL